MSAPSIVLIGGPNGAGKTTASRDILADTLGLVEFVNADFIAKGLSGFDPDSAALAAGRIMLARLKQLAAERATFAFESTLASRTFAPWLAELIRTGYELHLVFVWLRSPELAIKRVQHRIREGGHAVPPETIRRRYVRGIANFKYLYLPLASRWHVYDNSAFRRPELIAFQRKGEGASVENARTWTRILEIADEKEHQDDRRDL